MRPTAKGELGVVEVHNDVIAAIVEQEAVGVDGVVRFADAAGEGFAKRLGHGARHGLKVRVDDNGRIFIDLHVIVRYGTVIPDVARKVQETVMEALRTMTRASVTEINVHVDGIESVNADNEIG